MELNFYAFLFRWQLAIDPEEIILPDVITWEGMPVPLPANIEPRSFAERLIQLTESAPFTAFRWKRGGLWAAEVVGCVQVGRLRINILPKLDTPEPERDKSFLLNLLHSAGYLTYLHQGAADVRAENLDPMEAMISEAAKEMAKALREIHPRRYEEVHEDSPVLRGRIDFAKLSTRLPVSTTIPVRHCLLGINNKLSQILKGIAKFLYGIARSTINRQSFAAIIANLSHVDDRSINVSQIDSIRLSKYEMHWHRTLVIGRLLLSGQSPDPTFGGHNQMFSLLFPMQHLYERALRKILSASAFSSGAVLASRTQPVFLLVDEEREVGVVRLRPDYVFTRQGKPIAIADAKWKRASESDSAYGLKREDLYQLYAYLMRYKVLDAVILLPKSPWMSPGWTKSYCDMDGNAKVHLVGVDLEGLLSRSDTLREASINLLSEVLNGILSK